MVEIKGRILYLGDSHTCTSHCSLRTTYSKEQLIMATMIPKGGLLLHYLLISLVMAIQWYLGLFFQQASTLITLCVSGFFQFEDIFILLALWGHLSHSFCIFCSAAMYYITVVFFLCYYFMPWKVEGGVEGKVFSRNPQVAQRSLPSQITAASLGRALQLSILLQPPSPCFFSVCSSCATVAIQTL